MKRSRAGLEFKAHRLVYLSTLGSRVIKKKKLLQKENLNGSSKISCLFSGVRDVGFGLAGVRVKELGLRVWGLGV